MSTDATKHHLFSIIALISLNKVGCSNLRLAEDPTQGPKQTNQWKICKQLLNSRSTIEKSLVFNRRLILLCTAVFFNVFVVSKQKNGNILLNILTLIHIFFVLTSFFWGIVCEQLRQLQETIAGVDCDTVVVGTPIDLSRVIEIRQPTVRVTYSYADAGEPQLADVVRERLGLG